MIKYVKSLIRHFFIWTLAIFFWSIMRQYGQELVEQPNFRSFEDWLKVNLLLGLMAGVIYGSADHFISNKTPKINNFGLIIIIKSLINFGLFFIFIILGVIVYNYFQNIDFSWKEISHYLVSKENTLLIAYCYLISFLANFIKQLDRKFGPGNLYKILVGEFRKPQEVERVFLFLDLNSSTSIAEKIGHFKYSQLIQDCFADLKVIEKFQAEIYQYVGDEVVLTWNKKNAINNSNCITAYYAFKESILLKEHYYKSKYGVFPSFKGGMNFGKIMIAEVGEIKREIAYHGDTINVASRIQGICKDYGEELLISESLQELLIHENKYNYTFIKDIVLKGKENSIKVFSVKEIGKKIQD